MKRIRKWKYSITSVFKFRQINASTSIIYLKSGQSTFQLKIDDLPTQTIDYSHPQPPPLNYVDYEKIYRLSVINTPLIYVF